MINPAISDLFFNHDLSRCILRDAQGHFEGYDDEGLAKEAGWFLDALKSLGVTVPSIDALVSDFHRRL